MISNKGRVFSWRNLTIGWVRNSDGTGKNQKFDERKVEECSNIENITINSKFVDVNVYVSNSSKVEAHLYGEADINGDVNFDVQVVNRELRITLKYPGNRFYRNLQLDVSVPKKTFEVISAKSSSADITLNKGVSTDYLKVNIKSGDLETNATVNNISVFTMSGDVKLCIDATKDINVKVSTMSGDVSAKFNNIGHINLSTSCRCGDVINCHTGSRGYNADVDISTMSGDIIIR